MKQKKILFIEANTDGSVGGSYNSLLSLVKHIDKKKFHPTVLFYQKHSMVSEYEKYCSVIFFQKRNGIIIKTKNLFKIGDKLYLFKYLLKLFQRFYNFLNCYLPDLFGISKLLKRKRIDIVHINNAPFLSDWLIACKILKIKCVSHFRGIESLSFAQKKLIKFYDLIFSISEAVTENVKAQNIKIKNFKLIHNGIDIASFLNKVKRDQTSVRNEFQIEKEKPLIGVIGNIKEWKGQHVIIEALKILKEKKMSIKCLIVGGVANTEEDNNYFDSLKEMVEKYELNKNIIFTGFRKDIPDIVSAIDMMVHTSVSPEPFGRVIIEAMVLSKPVIATAHGGPVEIIQNKISGFLVPHNNPEILAQKIEYLVLNRETATSVGLNAKERVEKYFNIRKNVKNTEYFYSKMFVS